MKSMTDKQRSVLGFIVAFIADKGFPPTRVEIANNFEFKSPNASDAHLKSLQEKGKIILTPGVSRGIKVVKQ